MIPYDYFLYLIENDYNATKTINLMCQYLSSKFGRSFSRKEISSFWEKYLYNLNKEYKINCLHRRLLNYKGSSYKVLG